MKIPIYTVRQGKQKFIQNLEERSPMVSRVYEKYNHYYNIWKIYHVPKKAVYVEVRRMPYSI
jgi:hypothetical protein